MRVTLSLALFLGCKLAQAFVAPEILFPAGGVDHSVGASAMMLTDSAATLSVDQVLNAQGWEVTGQDVPNLGTSHAAHWLRFVVRNGSDEPRLILSIPHAEIDELDVYLLDHGRWRTLAHTGQSRVRPRDGHTDPEFVFELPIPKGAQQEVLVRVHGFKQIHVPLMLSTYGSFSQARAMRNLLLGGYVGIMLVMALYNLFVYFSIRQRSYLIYVLYILVISAAQLSFLGIGQSYLWPGSIWLSSRATICFALSAIVLGIEFARRFIGTEQYAPRLHRSAPLVYLAVAAIMGLYLFGDPWIGYQMSQAISGLTAVFLLMLVITAMRRGSRQAGFFLLAWAPFLLGVVIYIMKDAGALRYGAFTTSAMTVGSAIEGVLLSFGLAERIRVLRLEKERSQEQALAAAQENERITRDQNVILEQKVTERTLQLQESLDRLKQTQSQLVEAEKMSSLGQLTAGIAHEINNPVNYIRSNIPPLKRDMEDLLEVLAAYRAEQPAGVANALEKKLGLEETITEVKDILKSMEEGADRTAEIVRGLRTFSRLDEGDLKPADINEGLRSTLNILSPQIKDKVIIDLHLGSLPPVECLPGKLNQVFMNMLTNAIQAVVSQHGPSGGRVDVTTESAGDRVAITIADNGTGMTEDVRNRMFEPFFTTKAVGEGTGLGLSIAHSIIEKHQGSIEVDSVPGRGSAFRIVVPVNQQAQLAQRA